MLARRDSLAMFWIAKREEVARTRESDVKDHVKWLAWLFWYCSTKTTTHAIAGHCPILELNDVEFLRGLLVTAAPYAYPTMFWKKSD